MSQLDVVNGGASEAEVIEQAAKDELARSLGAEVETRIDTGKQSDSNASTNDANDQIVADGEDKTAMSLEERFAEMLQTNQYLHKKIDSLHGVYGNKLQQMQAAMDKLTGASGLRQTIAQLSVDDPAFEGLNEEFPELGGKIINGIRNILLREETEKQEQQKDAGDKPDHQQIDSRLDENDNPTQRRLALDHLQSKHPGFADIAGFENIQLAKGISKISWKDQEFGKWIEGMPEDIRETVLNGGTEENPSSQTILNILDVMDKYSAYKNSLSTKENQNTEEQGVVDIKSKSNKPKPDLSRSLLPSGRSSQLSSALTDEEIIANAARETQKMIMNGG